jgi:arylsulfatase A-like enzyme
MTGLYPHNHGALGNTIPLQEGALTIAELLDNADYRTGYIGKWHLGNEIYAQHGFTEWVSIDDNYHEHVSQDKDPHGNCNYYHFLCQHGYVPDQQRGDYVSFSRKFCTKLPEEHSKPVFVANEAQRFIREHKGEPFVLYVNFFEPHPPFNSAFDSFYDPQDVELPPCFDKLPSADAPTKGLLTRRYYDEISGMDNETSWRKLIARYWGMISLVDKQVGRILQTLKDSGLEDDTIIVYTSDHGDMMGDFHMLTKGMMFQSAARIPLLIKVPGSRAVPGEITEPVSLVDLVPTLLDIMGQQTERKLDGKSLYPAMKRKQSLEHNDVYIEWNVAGTDDNKSMFDYYRKTDQKDLLERCLSAYIRTVVTPDGWKLCLSTIGEHELYHLAEDPHETNNLYFKPGHEVKISELTAKIAGWQSRTGDRTVIFN